eukprot:12145967-Alexandrium_andersonii.AAC.1
MDEHRALDGQDAGAQAHTSAARQGCREPHPAPLGQAALRRELRASGARWGLPEGVLRQPGGLLRHDALLAEAHAARLPPPSAEPDAAFPS